MNEEMEVQTKITKNKAKLKARGLVGCGIMESICLDVHGWSSRKRREAQRDHADHADHAHSTHIQKCSTSKS